MQSFFCKKKSKSEGGGDHGLTVTFESFIRNMDDHIKFREFFFQHFGSFIDDLVAALSAGNTSEQQEIFQIVEVSIVSNGITEIDTY